MGLLVHCMGVCFSAHVAQMITEAILVTAIAAAMLAVVATM